MFLLVVVVVTVLYFWKRVCDKEPVLEFACACVWFYEILIWNIIWCNVI